MNATLFRSPWALALPLLPGAFLAWWIAGGFELGHGTRSSRAFLLASGWVALAAFLVVLAYVLRKYVHRTGVSPEFRMRVGTAELEEAERQLGELRSQIARGVVTSAADARERARAILDRTGVRRIVRAVVEEDPEGDARAMRVRALPTEPLGRVATWMHAHLYVGLAAGLLVLLHGAASLDSPLAVLLNGLSLAVVASGLFGTVVWAFGPTWITRREKHLSIEQAFVLDRSFTRKLEERLESEPPAVRSAVRKLARSSGGRVEAARSTLTELLRSDPARSREIRETLALVGQHLRVRDSLSELWRTRQLVSAWRIAHVPLSLALLGAIAVHLITVWIY